MNYPTSPRKETSSVSKLTVEYLKKFGQNRDLQQYFVLSTPITKSNEDLINVNINTPLMESKIPANILIGTKKETLWSDLNSASTSRVPPCEYQKTFENENIDTGRLSSASSVISDKRLEWDSGADVGYANYYNSKHKEKSLSLPALSTIESSRDNSLSSSSRTSKKKTTFVESTPEHITKTHKFFPQSETEITAIPIENTEEDVTHQNILQKDKSVSLEDTRLKPENSPKKSLSQIDLSNIEKSSVIENMYIFSPMFIKSLKDNKKEETSDKIIQTTLEKVSKLSSNSSDVRLFEAVAGNNDNSSKTDTRTMEKLLTGESSSSSNKRNQRNIDFQIPTSSSFEYIVGNKYNLEINKDCVCEQAASKDNENQVNTSCTLDLDPDSKLMNMSTSRSSNSSNHTQNSSGHSIGSILMGSQYSTDLTKDLEHTVSAMRNIIEAKQYTEMDKKRLIRKIVKKIVNTQYDDDQSPIPDTSPKLDKWIQSHSSENDKISNNNSDTPPDNISSPTVLVSKVRTIHSPEIISSPTHHVLHVDAADTSDGICDKNVNDDDEEIPQQKLTVMEEKGCWKKDITFSEQLFTERIKNLRIQRKQHHRNRDQVKKKKQRNIFTNVDDLQKKLIMNHDYGGDNSISNKQLLKISDKERENQLNWIKSEIYYLNQLRLLLEDNINDQTSTSNTKPMVIPTTTTTVTTQVYALFSNSVKNTSTSSPSNVSSSISQSEIENIKYSKTLSSSSSSSSSSLDKYKRHKSNQPNIKQNEIDKIIQNNYIFTELSSLMSNKCKLSERNKSSKTKRGTTDRDLQNKIISNIEDAQAKEIWKLDLPQNQSSEIIADVTSSVGVDTTANSNSSFEEKQGNIVKHPKVSVKVNPSVAIQTETINLYENLAKYIPIEKNKGQVEEILLSSNFKKDKQRRSRVIGTTNIIQQHGRNISTQTSDNKVTDNNSSSSGQNICEFYTNVKVNQATQTSSIFKNSSSSSSGKIQKPNQHKDSLVYYSNAEAENITGRSHKHKAKTNLISLNANHSSNSSQTSFVPASLINQRPSTSFYKRCTCSQQEGVHRKNLINQSTSPSLCLPLKSSSDDSQQNSQLSQISSYASPEIVPDSGTNSIEFIKNTNKPPSVPVELTHKLKSNGKSYESSNLKQNKSKERQYAYDINVMNYKTWPSHLESMNKILHMDKFINKPSIINKQISKDFEYDNKQKYSSDSNSTNNDNTKKSIDNMDKYLTMTKKCLHKQVEDSSISPSPSQSDVRNVPSCYSTTNYKTQLPYNRSPSSSELCEDISKESHVVKDYPPASTSQHSSSNHSSIRYYSRRISSEIITVGDVAHQNMTTKPEDENRLEQDQLHLPSTTPSECMYHCSKCEHLNCTCNCLATASSQLHLHKKIQQMLNRCPTCSKQQQQTSSSYNKRQMKYCSDCYCQCLLYSNSNEQEQINVANDECSNKQQQQTSLCNSCKLKQKLNARNPNSIAYFLRIESRDDLILEEVTKCNQQTKTKSTIEEVKIYVPKFIKNNNGHLVSNKKQNYQQNVQYVEEIGFNDNEKSFQSLQEYLFKNKPEFIDAATDRQQYLKEISEKRHKHTNSNMRTTRNYFEETNSKYKKKKLFTSKKMKEITYRKYRTLPEVEQKKYNMKLFRQRRANRLMMELFNKKLQQKVHKGELDLSLTKTLL